MVCLSGKSHGKNCAFYSNSKVSYHTLSLVLVTSSTELKSSFPLKTVKRVKWCQECLRLSRMCQTFQTDIQYVNLVEGFQNIGKICRVSRKLRRTYKKTSQESRKAALRISHLLLRCQVVFTKICHYYYCPRYYCCYCHYYYCHKYYYCHCHYCHYYYRHY